MSDTDEIAHWKAYAAREAGIAMVYLGEVIMLQAKVAALEAELTNVQTRLRELS